MVIKHEHESDDGQFTTGARRKVSDTTTAIVLECGDECGHVAAYDSLGRLRIHLTGVFVCWVVREVAANDKQVVVVELRT